MNETGVNPFIDEARRLWQFLDSLAENDPDQYREFILKQAQEAGLTNTPSQVHPNPPTIKQKNPTSKVSMMEELANIAIPEALGENKAVDKTKKKLIEELD